MTVLPYIVDGTADNFPRLVLENSRRGPVIVNYWSPKAGPCLVAMPRLVRVAEEYGGRLLVVMLNTDDFGELARRLEVRALPFLQVFRGGVVIDSLQGVESEGALRAFLNKYGARSDAILEAYGRGAIDRAVQLAAEQAQASPEDPEAALRVAKLLVLDHRPKEAFSLLDTLPLALRAAAEIEGLHAHLALIVAMDEEAEEGVVTREYGAEPLFFAAARALKRDEYEEACRHLIASYHSDPAYRQGLALSGMRAIAGLPMAPDVRVRLCDLLAPLLGQDEVLYTPL